MRLIRVPSVPFVPGVPSVLPKQKSPLMRGCAKRTILGRLNFATLICRQTSVFSLQSSAGFTTSRANERLSLRVPPVANKRSAVEPPIQKKTQAKGAQSALFWIGLFSFAIARLKPVANKRSAVEPPIQKKTASKGGAKHPFYWAAQLR